MFNIAPGVRRQFTQFLSGCAIFFLLAPSVSATSYYWIGNGASKDSFELGSNWSTTQDGASANAVPGSSDIAIFARGGVTARLRSNVIVQGLELNSVWTGALLQGTGSLTIGSSGFKVGAGAFSGSTTRVGIGLTGNYTQTGGVVSNLQGNFSMSGSFTVTGGKFTSTGTVLFSGNTAQTVTPGVATVFTSITVNNPSSVIVASKNLAASGSLTVSRGTLDLATNSKSVTVRRAMTVGGTGTGFVSLASTSNVNLSGALTFNNRLGTTLTAGTWNFIGKGPQAMNLNGAALYNMNVGNLNKTGVNTLTVTNPLNLSGALTVTTGQLTLGSNAMVAHGVTLASSASGALITSGNVANAGNVTIGSLATLTVSGGTWTQNSTANTTLNFAGKPIQGLTINNNGSNGSNTETLGAALNLSGALIVLKGNLDPSSYNINVTGNLDNSATLFGRGTTIIVDGNWTTEAVGTFAAGTSTVMLNGSLQTLSGSTTFYTLQKALTTASDTLKFAYGTTTHTTNLFSVHGAAGAVLSLASTLGGRQWFVFPEFNKYDVSYVTPSDSNATGTISCSNNCTDGGNNTGWVFLAADTGGSSSSSGNSGGIGNGGSRGGGGGGGGGRAPTFISPATTPVTPVTPVTPTVNMKNLTLKERIEIRKQQHIAFLARIQQRLDARKAKHGVK